MAFHQPEELSGAVEENMIVLVKPACPGELENPDAG